MSPRTPRPSGVSTPEDPPAPESSPAAENTPSSKNAPTPEAAPARETAATRKQRQRADRERAIVAAARELAETEGWDAVTTRRLAQLIEYSQPVLYSHFAGREAIVTAVALEGIGELADHLRTARMSAPGPDRVPDTVASAYLNFALANPALFDAMFTLPNGLVFGGPDSPEKLVEAFGEMVAAFGPLAGDEDPETFVELAWSALHGQTVLTMSARLRPHVREERVAMLIRLLKQEKPPAASRITPDLQWRTPDTTTD